MKVGVGGGAVGGGGYVCMWGGGGGQCYSFCSIFYFPFLFQANWACHLPAYFSPSQLSSQTRTLSIKQSKDLIKWLMYTHACVGKKWERHWRKCCGAFVYIYIIRFSLFSSFCIFRSILLFLYCALQAHVGCNFCKHHYISVEPAVFVVCTSGSMLGVTFVCAL